MSAQQTAAPAPRLAAREQALLDTGDCASVWTNDQWMPVLAVKPDGTQLFMGWYDRRSDTNNSLMDVYGRWAGIGTNGAVSFGNEFRISTVSFPPVFVGTLVENRLEGHFDPVYPPGDVNLHWWYAEWPEPPAPPTEDENLTRATYIAHVGEYNAAFSDENSVYIVWSDARIPSVGLARIRSQTDIRALKLTWPE